MIGLFKQKSPGNIVVLFLFGLMIKLPLFFSPKNSTATPLDGVLYQSLVSGLGANNGFAASALSFVLLYVQALMLIYALNEYRMLPRHNYLAGAAYLLLTSLLPDWSYLSAPLVSNTLVILLLLLLFRLYNTASPRAQVYNMGLVAGLASMVHVPTAAFFLCLVFGMVVLRPFRLNEIVLLLLGSLTPYYFYGVYLFLTDNLHWPQFLPRLSIGMPNIKNSLWLAASTALLGIPFLMGGYYVQLHLRKMLIQVRKNWSILLLFLLLAFLVPFANNNQPFQNAILLLGPFACFHASAYYYQPRNLIAAFLFFVTLGYVLYLQYGSPLWR